MPVTFALAGRDDEGEIRRLLRENPMGEGWRISLEREPDGFGGPHWPVERRQFVLARDGGMAVGLCERVVRPAFVDGAERWLPYLGALRVAQSHRHRIAVLKGGFAALRSVEQTDECPFALTSIAADNAPARRVLTAGIAGLPLYRPAGRYVTRMMRTKRGGTHPGIAIAEPDRLPAIAAFLREQAAHRQFAPAWTAEALAAQAGLTLLVQQDGDAIGGVIGVWDQRATRQAVLRGLPAEMAGLRVLANLSAPLHGLPPIPAVGESIEQVFLTALATRGDDPTIALALVAGGIDHAARAGVAVATIGLPDPHPWLAPLRARFRAIEYATELFFVHWPEAAAQVDALDGGPVFPDVALL